MALYRCVQSWHSVILDTPITINDTTGDVYYTFLHPVRNITFDYNISGRVVSGTLVGNLQLGVGGTWNFVVGEVSGQTTISKSGQHSITDNQKYKTIHVLPYIDDTGGSANCEVTSSIIKITAYEEYR